MENKKDESSKPKGLSTTLLVVIIGFIAIIALLVVAIYIILQKGGSDTPDSVPPAYSYGTGNLIIDESNLSTIEDDMLSQVEEGMFSTEMTVDWFFDADTLESTEIYVANSNSNTKDIYFEIILDDEVIYTSTVIPVGYSINNVKLEKELDEGDYGAVCMYYLLNDSGEVNSSLAINVALHVNRSEG